MKMYRPLTSVVLMMFIGACSESTQFNAAAGGKVINAERIINSDSPVTDPSADATSPEGAGNPSEGAGTTTEGGAAGDGTNPVAGTGAAGGPGAAGTGTTGANVGTGSSASPEAVASNVAKLKEACATGTKKTIKQSIHFPEVRTCNWNANGNLGRLNEHVQAIEGQKAAIELPANAQLCDLGIGSVATTIQYDDFMLLTLNNQVLLTSNKEMLVGLKEDQPQAFAWDFSKVRGKAINWNAEPYCLGDSSLCKIPVTDVQGAFQFNIDPDSLGKLAASTSKTKLDFALYSTGDNDDRDCWHTAFTLDFTLNYVE